MSNVEKILNRLDAALGKNKKKNTVDFKEQNELRKKSFHKIKPGKNYFAFLTPEKADDPFSFWGYHQGLQETAWYSTPCNAYNKGSECLVCNIVDHMKKEGYDKNKHLWFPIRQQIEVYAPAINVETNETIAEGVKWVKISKSSLTQMTEWLKNVEEGEQPFFSHEEPQKVIISYDKTAVPANQYSLDRKNMKPFSNQQISDWLGSLIPLSELIFSKSDSEIKKLTDEYFERIANETNFDGSTDTSNDTPASDGSVDLEKQTNDTPVTSSRLSRLKK